MPGNREAMRLWTHVFTQWRAGGCGIVGLDYPAVRMAAGWLGITWTYGIWRKIQALEHYELGRRGGGDAGSKSDHPGA